MRTRLGIVLAGLTVVAVALPAVAQEDPLVTICHKGETRQVAASSVANHLSHGDTQGPCSGPNPTTTTTTITPSPPAGVTGTSTPTTVVVGPAVPVGFPPGGWQVVAVCDPVCEPTSLTSGGTTGTLFSDPGDGAVHYLSILGEDALGLSCDGFEGQSELVVFDVAGPDVEKAIQVTYVGYEGAVEEIDACFAADEPFDDKFGDPAVFDPSLGPDGLYVGLLPDCGITRVPWWAELLDESDQPSTSSAPCIARRHVEGGTATVFVLVPAGDPVIRVG